MRNRLFLILTCAGIILLFTGITFLISKSVILSGVKDLEIQRVTESVNQLRTFLAATKARLHQYVRYWSTFEDIRKFVETRDKEYLEKSFSSESISGLNVSSCAFYDNSGQQIAFIPGTGKMRGDKWLLNESEALDLFVEKMRRLGVSSLSGYISVENEEYLFSAHTIVGSKESGQTVGLFIVSRSLDESFCEIARRYSNLNFTLVPLFVYNKLDTEPIQSTNIKYSESESALHAYTLLYDPFAKPSFCLELVVDRDYLAFGQLIVSRNFWFMILCGLSIFFSGVFLLYYIHRRQIREEMLYQVEHDRLTGLPNTRNFLKELKKVFAEDSSAIGIVFIDLERFNSINSSYGATLGDTLLCMVARRLCTRKTAFLIARESGSDEFFLAYRLGRDELKLEVEKIVEMLHQPYISGNISLHINASVGITCRPENSDDPVKLMHRAQYARHRAKSKGLMYVFYDERMDVEVTRRKQIESELYEAIEKKSFKVNYQPKVDIKNNDVAGCEALVRWQSKAGEWIPPPLFISIAEEIGLVTEIDMFVLRSACKQVMEWQESGIEVPVAVNMSVRSILSEGFVERVTGILQEEKTPPSLIEIEITETCFMTNMKLAIAAITSLYKAGIRIAVDDFGTGYSSLQYLSEMPISFLKIDKKFVDDIFSEKATAQPLVKSILSLASNLGMRTVSEGVEEKSQLDFLVGNGASIIQGYLFSRPLSGPACGDFLKRRQEIITSILKEA